MKKVLNILYSTRLMAVLFFAISIAMGVATFIENDYGTQTSKALVYNTWWFELIMIFFTINFFGNIFRYKLYKKEKWSVLLFHVAFLFILIGAGITRYISYEGLMIIDEGETTNTFFSDINYLNVIIDDNQFQKETNNKLLLSAWGSNSASFTEYFQPKKDGKNHQIDFKLIDYIPWVEKKFIEDDNGVEHIKFVESSSGSRHEHYIKRGQIQNIHNILVGFDAKDGNANINIFKRNDSLKIITKSAGNYQVMVTQQKGFVKQDTIQDFKLRSLYNVSGLPFVVPQYPTKGDIKTVRGKKDNKKYDMVIFDVTTDGKTERIELTGGQFNVDGQKQFKIGDLNFRAWYGAKQRVTPFSVKLNDFQLEKYPGSENAASFASEITVFDKDETFDFRIFMNNILHYKGYRLFQSSYLNAGEKIEQTHLSINHDSWGTAITYIGYFLLFFGLIASLFVKNTRFYDLKKSLEKIRTKKATLSIILLLISSITFSQHNTHKPKELSEAQIDSILQKSIVDKKHADLFSQLVIQDAGGRMKPAHTFASELVRKVAHTDNFKGLTPSQILVSITEAPMFWLNVPFIYLEKGNTQIREVLGLPKDTKYARFIDFYDENGTSKISHLVIEAQKKRIQSKLEQDAIKIERRVWLLSQALGGGILRIYPIPNDENNKWVSQPETSQANFKGTDSVFVRQSLPVYFQLLQTSKKTGDYTETNKILDGIKKFQRKFGSKVIPAQDKIQLEIAYNKANIFVKLAKYYGYVSLLMIIFVFFQIFNNKPWINYAIKAFIGIIIILFITHVLGLAARWYISGNAPWSNAYETIIFVGLASMLFGLILGKRSSLTIAATTFLTAIILSFAHQNWLDPEIANLVPVLNSWWLYVHVSIIVSGYGPFALGMILGIFSLFLIIFTNEKNKKKMKLHLSELTTINEMALTVGLVLFTVGNFLGGMWANESWGRYWGWDPKETWALISIMIYAFVLHMRLIPGLRSKYTFNLWSIIAFASVMMTYFGVNFYLSGLHSYASGDKVITPNSVYYSVSFVFIIGLIAWFKHKKFYKK
ncbi:MULTISPECIES: cytochrome c biogenesis protein CcsA [unclassified Tenacibaculum]|uniref:cytochrome c biogenesis protein CcsA n=1 Tax=unclassified Tenacibaculum TaxID=2635139 RepID=UPI001F28A90C|nr:MULTISPECIES: cytochrome c biogenesis protein CcsA [unclassified Tenacibaculum]MCF2876584.1 cytochrome c biogenesis protein CcsA [Tenacibaculum sp. Cn5-1]MCF2936735.1 cytochrome c biogenesis protein CcsA [Tenacibaculum sp. Cn5-34]MCG7512959.1 cytochrome c biogenesis protein CcsA [Tenacibaculum sp. Cn5-46]